ncbi:MAG: acyl-CoA dehydrogenase family protein [Candidatus Hydrogenedentes bacterium]|nr:acyl-CoA dehydrogenase family protein [Candidatus Hydrogenedentota bacterium]
MDFTLPEELELLRQSARKFAEEEIAPHAQDWDREAYFPDPMIKKLGDQGFMGILIPEAYGGAACGYMAFAIILEELARHDGGLALAVEAHNGLCCQHILIGGNEEQKRKYLPPLAAGDRIGSWCLTEPNSGSDAIAMQTTAVRDGDGWILNGAKQFITNGHRAGTFVVMAVTDGAASPRGITAFVVERDTPGLSTGKREEKLGMRSSDTVVVTLDNVRVPDSQRLGAENQGFHDVKKVLEHGRVMICAISQGFARGALEEAAKYSLERTAFGKPIRSFQSIQNKIADIAVHVEAGRLMLYHAAHLLELGQCSVHKAAMTKLFITEMATRSCMEAIQILGGYGYLRDYNVERYMRDAKLCEIGEGTSEVMRILISRTLEEQGVY